MGNIPDADVSETRRQKSQTNLIFTSLNRCRTSVTGKGTQEGEKKKRWGTEYTIGFEVKNLESLKKSWDNVTLTVENKAYRSSAGFKSKCSTRSFWIFCDTILTELPEAYGVVPELVSTFWQGIVTTNMWKDICCCREGIFDKYKVLSLCFETAVIARDHWAYGFLQCWRRKSFSLLGMCFGCCVQLPLRMNCIWTSRGRLYWKKAKQTQLNSFDGVHSEGNKEALTGWT